MRTQEPRAIHLKDYQAPEYFIDTVALTVYLSPNRTKVVSTLELRINERRARKQLIDALTLHGDDLKLVSLSINDRVAKQGQDYEVAPSALTILMPPRHFSLSITTEINPEANSQLEGLYLSNQRFYTQCEAHGFRRITYYLDRPDVLARFTTTLIADKKHYPVLLSNGNLTETGDLDDGMHFATWVDPHRKPAYLFALVAGDLERVSDTYTTQSNKTVDIHFYVEHKHRLLCAHAIESLKKAMAWDEQVYGLEYDLDCYMVVAVADFNMGAMENKGLNVFNARYVLADQNTATDEDFLNIQRIIGHEYFHNWTGNRVTLRDWFQLSLKEGLTVFREQCFSADMYSRGVERITDVNTIKTAQFAEDAGPMAHAIRPDTYIEMNNFYTVTVYNKGAEVIRMLQTLLGEQGFKQGMELYFARHDGQAVTTDDFLQAMADANHVNLQQFSLWYEQAGTPELDIDWEYLADKQQFILRCRQNTPKTMHQPSIKPFQLPIKMSLYAADGQPLNLSRPTSEDSTPYEAVVAMTEYEQEFVFEHVLEPPIPSLLRGFTAPVRLKTAHSDQDKRFLLENDNDACTRWQVAQELYVALIDDIMNTADQESACSQEAMAPFAKLLDRLLNDADIEDLSAEAQLLMVPTETYLVENIAEFELTRLCSARKTLMRALAKHLQPQWLALYHKFATNSAYSLNKQAIAHRLLQNLALSYLCVSEESAHLTLAEQQFTDSDNLTCRLHALGCIVDSEFAARESILESSYQQWQQQDLLLIKWLSVQARASHSDTLERVKSLVEHPAFSWTNPNKVYALLGSFGRSNLSAFHQTSGEGYRFMAQCIARLDSINPQVAARLMAPFMSWRRYDEKRAQLMENEIRQLLAVSGISKDLYELATRALS